MATEWRNRSRSECDRVFAALAFSAVIDATSFMPSWLARTYFGRSCLIAALRTVRR